MTTYAEENFGDDEDIYIICNSGQKGAQKATGVLEDAGIDASRIYTVEAEQRPSPRRTELSPQTAQRRVLTGSMYQALRLWRLWEMRISRSWT